MFVQTIQEGNNATDQNNATYQVLAIILVFSSALHARTVVGVAVRVYTYTHHYNDNVQLVATYYNLEINDRKFQLPSRKSIR